MMKFRKMLAMGLVMAAALLTGCSSEAEDVDNSSQAESTQESKEDTRENLLKDKLEGDIAEQTGETAVSTDIEALAAECVYNVYWYTQDDMFSAGTSFLMDSKEHGEKLLVTAFHYLWPEDADTFAGSELPEYIEGGEIYNAYTGDITSASLKSCLVIEDADAVPNVNKDVAAFTIQNDEGLKTLPLAEAPAKKGDKVYLLAYLWAEENMHENCVYEATVTDTDDGVMYYSIEGKPSTNGASGAPIVNEKGEVVAIHIGSSALSYVGHTADSFLEQINNGELSDVTYEAIETEPEAEPTEYLYFNREEEVSSMFYNVRLDGVTFSDTLDGEPCTEGYQFVVIDIALSATADQTEPVPMYYSDFALEWEEEYCYPLEAGWTEAQLPDEYSITQDITTGQLVFIAPIGEELLFSFIDTYYLDNPDENMLDKYYGIEIPVENWVR